MDRMGIRTLGAAAVCVAGLSVSACSAESARTSTAEGASVGSMIPEGVYRSEITVDEALEAGMPAAEVRGNTGIRTLTIDDGEYRLSLDDGSADCTGTLTTVDDRTRFTEDQPPMCSSPSDPKYFDVSWSVDGDRLVLSDLTVGEPRGRGFEGLLAVVYTSEPWTILE